MASAEAACERLAERNFNCIILDLNLPLVSGQDALSKIASLPNAAETPIIIYTGNSLSREEQRELSRLSSSIVLKGAESPDRLLDEVTLFLHKVDANLPDEQQQTLRLLHNEDAT